jgi:5-methylcytosine-specific restriction endonuclease McrA
MWGLTSGGKYEIIHSTNKEVVMDENRKCEVTGCGNLGAWNRTIHGKVYRSPLCCKHKRLRYGMRKVNQDEKIRNRKRAFRKLHKNTCMLCGWIGPCDVHRKVPNSKGGKYTEENSMLICPNCHRLQHPEVFPLYE